MPTSVTWRQPTLSPTFDDLPFGIATAAEDSKWFFARLRARELRTMRQFAEDEIVLPDGPYMGRRFKVDRQPYTGLWFDEIDSGRWSRCVATGPVQSGKTLACFVTPLLYHLFEIGETVICGLPTLEMAADKWREDILPVIEASGFRHLLPRHGSGSRGGKVESIKFANGATLKFMSGGGHDKKRAGFTARVLVITETDGMDEPGKASREADKITQLEARTRAFGARRRVYMECTVSTEEGRTWREYNAGSQTKIALACPKCRAYVMPERKDLHGWDVGASEMDAKRLSQFACPDCGEAWTEDDRRAAHAQAKAVHRGQTIDDAGNVTGDLPETETLGFRWSGVHNLFLSAGDIGQAEWRAARSANEDNAEKEQCQFYWAIPHAPATWQTTSLDAEQILARTLPIPKGVVPADYQYLTLGMDVQKFLIYWSLVAWRKGGTCHVVDYSRFDLATDQIGVERAIMAGLRQFRESVETGWPQGAATMQPNLVLIDSGFNGESVRQFCEESGPRYMPSLGRGLGQQHALHYTRPKSTGALVRMIGEEYHAAQLPNTKVWTVEANADYWKSWLHQRLTTAKGEAGALTLFDAQRVEHIAFAKHLTAERQVQQFVAGRGHVTKWEAVSRSNHWLDATYLAAVAAHACGVRLFNSVDPQIEPAILDTGAARPDGRPWIPA